MGILGSGSIHMANRYAKKPAYRSANAATTVCQKCLQAGHWTYECKNAAAYQSRPTRTKQLTDPKYKPRFLAPGELLPEHRDKEPEEAAGKQAKGGKKRKKKPAASSSSSDDSSSDDSSDSSSSSSSSDDSSSDDSSSSSSSSDSDSDSSSGTSSSSSDDSDDSSSSDSDSSSSSDSELSSGSPSPEPPSRKKAKKLAEASRVTAESGAAKPHKGAEKAARAEREPKGDLGGRRGEHSPGRQHESNGVRHHEEERVVARQGRPRIRSTVVARD
ncbi:g1495 [Coccomyxa elongata]